MATKLHSGQIVGLKGVPIEVEIDLVQGLHHFSIVGLADKAVDEAKERVSAAIKNSGYRPPQKKNHRITVNLAPADLPKEGATFDLPIALAYLAESGQIRIDPDKRFFAGELALSGALRPVRGILPLVLFARAHGFREAYIPSANIEEAKFVSGISIFAAATLEEIVAHLEEKIELAPVTLEKFEPEISAPLIDFSDIKGQELAKRGIEIAAAGNHHVAFIGPPGTGKTLLARALPSILPPLTFEEALEITSIHSVAGALDSGIVRERPFRSPHHTASYVSLVGGGAFPKPGEITLAHRGVLFLDEFPEFERRVIESLRQPLEDKVVTVSRARATLNFPAQIMMILAMNPCPCGNLGTQKGCICPPYAAQKYQRKISGPIIDRIDLWLGVYSIDHKKLEDDSLSSGEKSKEIRQRVEKAREIQQKRFAGTKILTNSEMSVREIKKYCSLDNESKSVLQQSAIKLDLSPRSYHRVIKLARTIADLAGKPNIKKEHIYEALQYRPVKQD